MPKIIKTSGLILLDIKLVKEFFLDIHLEGLHRAPKKH